ncbi:MAG: hypothetical protein ACFFAY_13860, partial [Promethearchaeota archaeon]
SVDAIDVAFSIGYYVDSIAYGNPTGVDIVGLVAAYASGPNTAVIEFDSESYWNLDSIAYLPILPEHIFSSIGLSGWNTWNPIFSDPMITAAPFSVSAFSSGEYVVLSKRSDFFYRPEVPSPPTITPVLVAFAFEGTTGNAITWNASSNFADHYELFIDSALVANESWDGGTISFNIDHLPFGTYSYTLTVYACGGFAIDSGLIMVLDITPPNLESSPGNVTYVQNAPDNIISWTFNDTNPGVYQIFVDAEPYRLGLWNSSSEAIDVDLTNMTLGEHNVTVLVVDYGFNQAMDTIYVNVIAFAPEMLMLLAGGIGAAVVIAVVFFWARNR